MSVAVLFDSSERTDALVTLARHGASLDENAGLNIDLLPYTDTFGPRAQLVAKRDAAGRADAFIQTATERIALLDPDTTGTRSLTEAERLSFDHAFPQIARDLQTTTLGSIEAPSAARIAHLLHATPEPQSIDINNASNAPTILARPPEHYIAQYVTPLVTATRTQSQNTEQRALETLNQQSSDIIRVNHNNERPIPSNLRSIQFNGDNSAFIFSDNLKAEEKLRLHPQVQYLDARGPALTVAELSTRDSARLLTAIDNSRNLEQWQAIITHRDHSAHTVERNAHESAQFER